MGLLDLFGSTEEPEQQPKQTQQRTAHEPGSHQDSHEQNGVPLDKIDDSGNGVYNCQVKTCAFYARTRHMAKVHREDHDDVDTVLWTYELKLPDHWTDPSNEPNGH